jgi:ADP-ribose pyrophosphatase YjhB (NUDIX family)
MNNKKFCSNCNKYNHEYKECKEPITSWGIILVDYSQLNNNEIIHKDVNLKKHIYNINIQNKNDIENISKYMNNIKFLLIQRRHSIGFMDFIRGKYKTDNIEQINSLFQYMHQNEINLIKTLEFEDLWKEIWNFDERKINSIKKEFIIAKEKFMELKTSTKLDLNLDFYLNNIEPLYSFLEWGYPKGRKDKNESILECAIREFYEETNIDITKIKVINEINPIEENLIGTNGIPYRHIYYIAETKENINLENKNNNEIGNVGFFTYDESQKLLRDYHIEKKQILEQIYMYYLEILLENSNKNSNSNS